MNHIIDRLSSMKFILLVSFMFPIGVFAEETLSMKDCLVLAHQNNKDLAGIHASTIESGADVAFARSQIGPQINLNWQSRIQSEIPEMNQPESIIDTPMGSLVIPGRSLELGSLDTHSLDLEISQLLYTGGRLTGRVEFSRMNEELAQLREILAVRKLDSLAAGQFLQLHRISQLLETSRKSLELTRRHADDVNNLYTAGAVTQNESLKADLRVSEAEASVIALEVQQRYTAENLSSIIGRNLDIPVDLDIPQIRQDSIPDIETVFQKALQQRFELKTLNKQIELLQKELDLTGREKYPVISAFGKVSYGKPGLDFIANEWSDTYVAGIQCNLNAWDNHRRSSREMKLQLTIETLQRQLAAQEERIRLEIIRSCLAIDDVKKRLDVSNRALNQSLENFRITEDKFREGVLTNTDYLDAEIALSRASTGIVLSETDLDQAWIDFYTAAGSDFMKEEWLK